MKKTLYILKKLAFSIFAALFLTAYFISTRRITKAKPMMFPNFLMTVTAIVVVLAIVKTIVEAVREIREGKADDMPDGAEFWQQNKKQIVVIVTLIADVILMRVVGFYVMTFIYIFGVSYYLGLRNLKIALPLSIGVTGVFYLLFSVLLRLHLPTGLLF